MGLVADRVAFVVAFDGFGLVDEDHGVRDEMVIAGRRERGHHVESTVLAVVRGRDGDDELIGVLLRLGEMCGADIVAGVDKDHPVEVAEDVVDLAESFGVDLILSIRVLIRGENIEMAVSLVAHVSIEHAHTRRVDVEEVLRTVFKEIHDCPVVPVVACAFSERAHRLVGVPRDS